MAEAFVLSEVESYEVSRRGDRRDRNDRGGPWTLIATWVALVGTTGQDRVGSTPQTNWVSAKQE